MGSDEANPTLFSAVPVLRPRQQVESQLRQAILDGVFPGGQRLPSEQSLAASFSVGRATVREALRSLAASGLLVKGAGTTSGLYAQSIDHVALSRVVSERLASVLDVGSVTQAEVSSFRDILEVPSARLAAMHRTDRDLETLRGIIEEERFVAHDDPAVPELNARFHSAIGDATQNRVLSAFVSAMHRTTRPLAFVHTDEQIGRQAVTHHIELYRAIKKQDVDAAMHAMRAHLAYLSSHADTDGAEARDVS